MADEAESRWSLRTTEVQRVAVIEGCICVDSTNGKDGSFLLRGKVEWQGQAGNGVVRSSKKKRQTDRLAIDTFKSGPGVCGAGNVG